jgi:hypothetical protein
LAATTQSARVVNKTTLQNGQPQALVQSQPTQITVTGVWQFRTVSNAYIQLQCQRDKDATGTTSLVDASNTMLGAIWCGTG